MFLDNISAASLMATLHLVAVRKANGRAEVLVFNGESPSSLEADEEDLSG